MNCSCSRRQAVQLGGLLAVGVAVSPTVRADTGTGLDDTIEVDVFQSFTIDWVDNRERVSVRSEFDVSHAGTETVYVRRIEGMNIEMSEGVEFQREESRADRYTVSDGESLTVTYALDTDDYVQTVVGLSGEWGFVAPERLIMPISTPDHDFDMEIPASTPGVVRGHHTMLGEYTQVERKGDLETIELVAGGETDLATTPEEICETLAHTSDSLTVGGESDRVTIFAIPNTDRSAGGSSNGSNTSAWVTDSFPLDAAVSIWDHEYVHTRQEYQGIRKRVLADDTRWLFEAQADHYGALIPYESGRVSFNEMSRAYERGRSDHYGDAVLADRESWRENRRANYTVGALVLGWLDLEIRRASSNRHRLDDLFAYLNDLPRGATFTHDDLLEQIGVYADSDVVEQADEYITTDARPDVWDEETHEEYFLDERPPDTDDEGGGDIDGTNTDTDHGVGGSENGGGGEQTAIGPFADAGLGNGIVAALSGGLVYTLFSQLWGDDRD